ncbi:beta-lactamase (plasmid) [Gemmatirosa kalamazoonensis]|uniref:Beta-lactamase n=1 Tax=Gemmatirosa kalamazoonensis TaxID=861299 RepID=W0RTW8_9BACT|nr:serine hydrolase [Gemmatirosa kalamazoonensis]AHG93735.1 beta-lactamase [Gemmatirosa kalamazoonensis]
MPRALLLLALLLAVPACAEEGAPPNAEASAPRLARRERLDSAALAEVYARAATLPKLRSLLVEQRDTLVAERYFGGARRDRPANLKSASKSVVSALVGAALAEGALRDLRQTVGELLPADARGLDSAKRAITLEDLLSMRSGLESTSIGNYGAWVSSRDWIRYALARPMVAPPGHDGGPMIYSTGNTHLLAAILTRATGASLYRQYVRALARPLGIAPREWPTDPRGIYFGGNEMRMTPREMLRFGALYLHGGVAPPGTPAAGRQILPRAWVDSSWAPRTTSGFSGHQYGYGWWQRASGGHAVHFAWGYGGQFVFVVPDLALVVVATSDPDAPERDHGHLDAVHALLDDIVAAAGR